jgi:ribosomal protein S10
MKIRANVVSKIKQSPDALMKLDLPAGVDLEVKL